MIKGNMRLDSFTYARFLVAQQGEGTQKTINWIMFLGDGLIFHFFHAVFHFLVIFLTCHP